MRTSALRNREGVAYNAEIRSISLFSADKFAEVACPDVDATLEKLRRRACDPAINTGIYRKAFIPLGSSHVAGDDTVLRPVIATHYKIRGAGGRPVDTFGADRLTIQGLAWRGTPKQERHCHAYQQHPMPERALLKRAFAVGSLSNPLESYMLIHGLHSLPEERGSNENKELPVGTA